MSTSPRKRHLLLRISYVGTAYCGFQVQKNALSVAEVLQNAMESVFGARLDIKGCSRTDAGVHAYDFAVAFFSDKSIPCERVTAALNRYLPSDIAVKSCSEVEENFHPRYHATAKTYLYRIWNAPIRNPFLEQRCLHCPRPLDVGSMSEAASLFVGTHDFSAFTNTGGSVADKVRTVYSCSVEKKEDEIHFWVTGNGFLYNMVRIMIGTLLEVGTHHRSPASVEEAILSKHRTSAGPTAPAHGLYLYQVHYESPEDLCKISKK